MSRKAARETAMKLVFAQNFGNTAFPEPQDELYFSKNPDADQPEEMVLSESETEFMQNLVEGTARRKDEIMAVLSKHSIGWKTERMPKVDLAILQLCVYELCYTDMKVNIAINEAVELAKKYSTADSASFINGLLAKVVQDRT